MAQRKLGAEQARRRDGADATGAQGARGAVRGAVARQAPGRPARWAQGVAGGGGPSERRGTEKKPRKAATPTVFSAAGLGGRKPVGVRAGDQSRGGAWVGRGPDRARGRRRQ